MLDVKRKACLHIIMTKREAIEMFGSVRRLADALGITPQAIYQWPDVLDRRAEDRVVGASVRIGIADSINARQAESGNAA